MSTSTRFQCFAVFGVLSTCSALVFAAGGTVRFSGAVLEPACTVQNPAVEMKTLAAARTGGNIPLSVYCNASQSVQISLQDMGAPTGRRTFDGGGAEIAISHGAVAVGPGDTINYSFRAKQEVSIPLTGTLRKAANVDPKSLHSSVLVSFDYR